MNPQMPQTTAAPNPEDHMARAIPDDQARRAALYGLLAALLRSAPGEEVLDYSRQLTAEDAGEKNELPLALSTLALAARHSDAESLRDEYHTLFIGLGRGEMVPYGSWYQTGFLMEKPLALLRSDLSGLGFERDDEVHEPEDHIAALCEVMSMLILDQVPIERQRQFFTSHVGNWAKDFFDDLAEAHSAVFYKSVARLGRVFMALETRYLSLFD